MTTPNPFKQAIDQLRLQAGISNYNYAVRTRAGDHDAAKEVYDHAVSCNCAANFLEQNNPAEIGGVISAAPRRVSFGEAIEAVANAIPFGTTVTITIGNPSQL